MPIPKDLDDLLAAAGRAEADEKRRTEDARTRREREVAEHFANEAQALKDAPSNAEAVFAWLGSDEARELRETMCRHGVARIRLGTYGILHGERRPGPSFGSCTFYVLADAPALNINVLRGYHGNRSRRITSTAELVDIVPPRALARAAAEVRAGGVYALVRESLGV